MGRDQMQSGVCLGLKFCTLALLVTLIVGDSEGEQTFGYDDRKPDGPQHWGDLNPEWALCGDGREQSGIHIHIKKGIIDEHLTELNISYVPANFFTFHNGHALDLAVVDDGNAGEFHVDGETYIFSQLHFHSPSEHVIDGHRFPLDMHLVHKTADGKKIAVIGVPFKYGPPSPFLDEFWDKLALLNGTEEVEIGELFVGAPKLNIGPSYARYRGSLTTPPCTEGVTWTVALDGCNTISYKQLKAFKDAIPEANARPLQKLYGRKVRLFKP